ncbi:MAG TPA: AMP-binding protein, partial [Chakrabartia sp.]|nr:AMP-binding protein [Chakrabartia sp.]
MSEQDLFPVPAEWAKKARVNAAKYQQLYGRSIADSGSFWLEQARRLDWIKRPEIAGDWSFDATTFHINWFSDGKLNASANCIDRHAKATPDRTAIIWEPDVPTEEPRRFTYKQLLAEVSRFANVLKANGVQKGDRVTIYMPMIPEAAFALLACARIGAIHSVIFGGFSPESIAGRVMDCDSKVVITADEGRRGGKHIALKTNVDEAYAHAPIIEKVIVVKATGADIPMTPGRDVWYHDEAAKVEAVCPPEPMMAEDPLFILYTSGSTGKPKGVLHTTGGYLVWAGLTHQLCFDYRPGDIFL